MGRKQNVVLYLFLTWGYGPGFGSLYGVTVTSSLEEDNGAEDMGGDDSPPSPSPSEESSIASLSAGAAAF